ncbi:hypothetical protein GCM10025871_15110 [Deinococcus metallilatus]|nr:hypothetical protein GCM10025871_15110 [Deinococcus metallilatus]
MGESGVDRNELRPEVKARCGNRLKAVASVGMRRTASFQGRAAPCRTAVGNGQMAPSVRAGRQVTATTEGRSLHQAGPVNLPPSLLPRLLRPGHNDEPR